MVQAHTFRWLLEPMLTAAGFDILTADFAGSVYGSYTCRRRCGLLFGEHKPAT